MKIAITGATGQLGRLVINKLTTTIAAEEVVALVRTPSKATDLGVVVREADYNNPATLVSALAGVTTLVLISSSEVGQRAAQHRNVIEAARKNGVECILYTSLLHADTSAITALSSEHLDTEAAIKSSGLSYTILRNGWYTENYTASVPGAVAGGAFLGSAKDGKISSAARSDYAEAIVAVLTSEGHDGKVYELAGDATYTLTDLAAELSQQTKNEIPYKNLPEAEYASILAGFGLPTPLAQAIALFDSGAAQDALFDEGKQLSRLIGHATTPLSASIAVVLKA